MKTNKISVQELIDTLSSIEDKTKSVFLLDNISSEIVPLVYIDASTVFKSCIYLQGYIPKGVLAKVDSM